MSRGLAVLGAQERLHELPGHARPYGPPAETDDVHVIVLDPLPRGKVVMDQRGTDTRKLVGADRGAHTAAAARPRNRRRRGRRRGAAPPDPLSSQSPRDRWRFPRAWCLLQDVTSVS